MGLLDIFKKKSSPSRPASPEEEVPEPLGWDAITEAFLKLYPGQTDPPHRAPAIHRMHDLSENAAAFDGMSAYDAGTFWHLVSFGLTELYAKESEDQEVSGFGFEFTFRIPKAAGATMPPVWAFDFLDAIGKSVWKGAEFSLGHTIKTGPLDGRPETKEDAVLLLRDPSLPEVLETPHGRVEFFLLLGVENAVREEVLAAYEAGEGSPGWQEKIVSRIRQTNADLITPIDTSGEWGKA